MNYKKKFTLKNKYGKKLIIIITFLNFYIMKNKAKFNSNMLNQ